MTSKKWDINQETNPNKKGTVMSNGKKILLRDMIFCVILATLFMMVGAIFPIISIPMIVVANLPMFYLSVRYDLRVSAGCTLIILILFILVTGDVLSVFISGAMSLLPGIVMGRALTGKFSFATIIIAGAGVFLFGFLLQLILLNASGNGTGIEDLVNQSLENVRRMGDETFSLLNQQGIAESQEIQKVWNGAVSRVREIIFLYLPAFFIGASTILSYFVLMAGIFVLHRTRTKRIIYRPFWGFVASRSMCHLTMILFLITTFSFDSTIWTAALKNMTVLLYGCFGICGFSFIDYKLRKKVPSGYARSVIYLATMFVTYFFAGILFRGLCILGMLDSVFGFRRFYKVGEKYDQNQ